MGERSERGAASLELVILAPMLFAILSLILMFGRYAETEGEIDQAARDAARAATAQNDSTQISPIADSVVSDTLDGAPSSCRDSATVTTTPSPNAYQGPDENDPAAVGWISVEVTCTLDLSDLGPLPLQDVQLTRTFSSPLDQYRGFIE